MEVKQTSEQTPDWTRTLGQSPDRTETFRILRNLINKGIQKRHHLNGSHLRIEINWNLNLKWIQIVFWENISKYKVLGLENDRMLNKNPGFEIDFERKALKLKSGLDVLNTGVLDLENEMQWHAILCNAVKWYAK